MMLLPRLGKGTAVAGLIRTAISLRGSFVLRACTLVLAGWIIAAAGPARAAGVALVTYGKAESRLQALASEEVRRSLREAGWDIVPPFSDVENATVKGCMGDASPWTCMRFVTNNKGIDRLVAVQVDAEAVSGSQAQLVLTGQLVWQSSSAKLAQTKYCLACKDDEVRTYAAQISKYLIDEYVLAMTVAKVEVKSQPVGAEVVLDGALAGLTNNVFITSPGKHQVVVRLGGYQNEQREVETKAGTVQKVEVVLQPAGVAAVVEPESKWWRDSTLVPKVMVGVGVVTMVAAAGLYLGDVGYSTKKYRVEEDYENNKYNNEWRAVLGAAGGVLAAGGGVWWWRSSKRSAKPAVTATARGVSLGITGSF